MKKISLILAALLLIVSCGDANRQYVRKAIRIMDKQGLFAEGPGWESAKAGVEIPRQSDPLRPLSS